MADEDKEPQDPRDEGGEQLGAAGTSKAGAEQKKQQDDQAKGSGEPEKKSKAEKPTFSGKRLAGVAAAAPAALIAAQLALLMMFLKLLKLAMAAAAQVVQSLLAAIIQIAVSLAKAIAAPFVAIGGAIASAMGGAVTTATAGVGIFTSVATLLTGGVAAVTEAVSSSETAMRDGDLAEQCLPATVAGDSAADREELDEELEEQAEEIYAILAGMGMSDTNIAGLLGNFTSESNLDPTSVETIMNEPYEIGSDKQAAWDANWDISSVDPAYAAQYPAIDKMGIGLAQWTNGRNTLLEGYADEIGAEWYELDTQIGFMFSQDDSSRVSYMENFRENELDSPADSARDFMTGWIGLSADAHSGSGNGLSARRADASEYMGMMSGWDADSDRADSILEQAGEAGDAATGGAANNARSAAEACDTDSGRNVDLSHIDCAAPGTGVEDYGYGGDIEDVLHPNAMDGFLCGYGTWSPEAGEEMHRWHSYRPPGTGIGAGDRSDHTYGAALDISSTHLMDTGEGQKYARDVAEWYAHHAEELQVTRVIYWEKTWTPSMGDIPFEEWDRYPQNYCSSPSWDYMGSDFPVSISNPQDSSHGCAHRNHPHVSFEHANSPE